MKIETHKCDLCGKQATSKEGKAELDLAQVIVGLSQSYYTFAAPQVHGGHKEWTKDACLACRTRLGVTHDQIKANPETPNLTLEEVLREIMREEIEQATGANR